MPSGTIWRANRITPDPGSQPGLSPADPTARLRIPALGLAAVIRANAGAAGLSLTGNEFNNTVVGGAGADTFSFTAFADSTVAVGGRDTIRDFVSGDKIDLHLIDANASLAFDQAFSFIGTNAFSGAAGQLHYAAAGGNTLISGDVNGDKVSDLSILVS